MRRDSERRPSWTTEAAEDHQGTGINPSVQRHSDSWPARGAARLAANIDMIDVALATALVLLLPLAVVR